MSTPESGPNEAFRWTQATGMVSIGNLGGYAEARAVNADGSVVVGKSYLSDDDSSDRVAFRWTQGTGMVNLGTLGGYYAEARAVSANGAVVVGDSITSDFSQSAFRWTQATGMRNLNTLLADAGVDMTGIRLFFAAGISADGQFIAGTGNFPNESEPRAYLVRYDDGAGEGSEGGGPPIAGLTTPQSTQDSINALALSQGQTLIHQHGFVAPLLGFDKPMGIGSEAGVFASAGSFSGGGHARYANGNGFSIIGGIAYASENYAAAELKNSVIGAVAVQHVLDTGGWWRPFVEGGGWLTPKADLKYSRTYANGAGTATGIGDTRGDLSYYYGRMGVLLAQTQASQLALSGEIGHQRLSINGYIEPDGPQNPFPAAVSAGTDSMNLVKARLQMSHAFDARFDATLYGAYVHGFDRKTSLTANVLAMGVVTPTNVADLDWFEYGARLGFALNQATTLDVFANGVSGGDGIGTKIHAGGGLRVRF
jgi:probable HAF family extracellular repeat protein